MTYPLGKIWQPRWFALIRQEYPDQPVYLCGESFGACLALQVIALAPDIASHFGAD